MSTSSKRESHKQALRQLLDRYIGNLGSAVNAQLVDEILRVHDRFTASPDSAALSEAELAVEETHQRLIALVEGDPR
jgi:hypothetical protein